MRINQNFSRPYQVLNRFLMSCKFQLTERRRLSKNWLEIGIRNCDWWKGSGVQKCIIDNPPVFFRFTFQLIFFLWWIKMGYIQSSFWLTIQCATCSRFLLFRMILPSMNPPDDKLHTVQIIYVCVHNFYCLNRAITSKNLV